jgi:uncharacterized protein YjiS (DUF1127 family)
MGKMSNDHEWIRILISAVVGMLTGLIADPIRSAMQHRIEAGKLKNAVMTDIGNLSVSAMDVYNGKLEASKFWLGVELPGFEYYWEKNRELFYINTKTVLLRVQCQVILRLCGLVKNNQKTPEDAMFKLWETLAYIKIIHEMSWAERRRAVRSLREGTGQRTL